MTANFHAGILLIVTSMNMSLGMAYPKSILQ
jgi:hypothetical protein